MDYCFNNDNVTKDKFKDRFKVLYKFLIDNIDEFILNHINIKISDNAQENHIQFNVRGKRALSYKFTYGKRIFSGNTQVSENSVIDTLSNMIAEYDDSISSMNDTNLKYLYYIYPYKGTFSKSLKLAKFYKFYKSVFETDTYKYLGDLKGYLRKFIHEYDVSFVSNTRARLTITIFLDTEKSYDSSNYVSIKFISDINKNDSAKRLERIIVLSKFGGSSTNHEYDIELDDSEDAIVNKLKNEIKNVISHSKDSISPKHSSDIANNTQVIVPSDYGSVVYPEVKYKGKLCNFLSYKTNTYKSIDTSETKLITVDDVVSKKLLGVRVTVKKSNVIPSTHDKYVIVKIGVENNKPIFSILDEKTYKSHYSLTGYDKIHSNNLLRVTKEQIVIS